MGERGTATNESNPYGEETRKSTGWGMSKRKQLQTRCNSIEWANALAGEDPAVAARWKSSQKLRVTTLLTVDGYAWVRNEKRPNRVRGDMEG